jgi:hypothetical protein
MCNGTDAKKWDGTTVTGWGITAPAVATSISTSAGSLSPTSGYRYVYTYKNSTSGHESTASPESASTGAQTSKNFKMTGTLSTDPQVDKINIYRTVDAGSKYNYLTTVNNDTGFSVTGYTDSSADSVPEHADYRAAQPRQRPAPDRRQQRHLSHGAAVGVGQQLRVLRQRPRHARRCARRSVAYSQRVHVSWESHGDGQHVVGAARVH